MHETKPDPRSGRCSVTRAGLAIELTGLLVLTALMWAAFHDPAPRPQTSNRTMMTTTVRLAATEPHVCLEAAPDGTVSTHLCTGEDRQLWRNQPRAATVTLTNVATGHCLVGEPQGRIVTATCDGSGGQRWQVNLHYTGRSFRNTTTDMCLSATNDGTSFGQPCDGGGIQRWILGNG